MKPLLQERERVLRQLRAYIRECIDDDAWPTAEQIMHVVNSSAGSALREAERRSMLATVDLIPLGDALARAVEQRWSGPGRCDCEVCSAAKAWQAARGKDSDA